MNGGEFVKAKILCTIGPATDTKEKISQLIDAGMDGMRLNFSHGDHKYYEKLFGTIKEVFSERKFPVTVLQDLQGPKIRIGELAEKQIMLKQGEVIEITNKDVVGTKDRVSISYKPLISDAAVNDKIYINDGLLKLKVIEKRSDLLKCVIMEGGILSPKKGVNLPGMKLSASAITEKDFSDLEFSLNYNLDYIALSFVREPKDILELKNWLKKKNADIPIIAKIEKKEAVDNFEDILKLADGIMIARGDLGVELSPQEAPIIQKRIITRCNEVGKLVITATQMLESMVHNPIPTRAEASDVANAVWDGTDVVMLSAETSVGSYPIETVRTMSEIAKRAEEYQPYPRKVAYEYPEELNDKLLDAMGESVAKAANRVGATVRVVYTNTGKKAFAVSRFRPKAKIIAVSDNFKTVRKLSLYRGILPYYLENIDDEQKATETVKKYLLNEKFIKPGDMAAFSFGSSLTDVSRRNNLTIEII
ncbi:MAG TPA: pyruvate kinase [Ignavibacteriales bacterium]|nr:pyruvate kinase [Ignavibacteriales bacterium]